MDSSKWNGKNNLDVDVIILRAFGITTQWRFPIEKKNCPVSNCRKMFENRSSAIEHYKSQHANNALLCPICVKPISMGFRRNFVGHYTRLHPNLPIPYDLASNHQQSTYPRANQSHMITLSGCGRKTEWQFSRDLVCPTQNCRRKFIERSEAIDHYIQAHASHSICCYLCNKPIVATSEYYYEKHYKKLHQHVKDPWDFESIKKLVRAPNIPKYKKKAPISRKRIQHNRVEDLITFRGRGQSCEYETYWRFPKKRTECVKCKFHAANRDAAIRHYKECISLNAIVCPECNVPIPTIFKERYIIHYSTNHPEIEDPYAEIAKFIVSIEESLCPLKTCDFRAKDGQIIRDHWHEAHNHLRFPEVRGISVNHEDPVDFPPLSVNGLESSNQWEEEQTQNFANETSGDQMENSLLEPMSENIGVDHLSVTERDERSEKITIKMEDIFEISDDDDQVQLAVKTESIIETTPVNQQHDQIQLQQFTQMDIEEEGNETSHNASTVDIGVAVKMESIDEATGKPLDLSKPIYIPDSDEEQDD